MVDMWSTMYVASDCAYFQELKKWFEDLRRVLEENDAESEYLNMIDQYAGCLLEAIKEQYSGNVSQAQILIDQLLENLVAGDEEIAVTTIANSIAFNDIEDATDEIDTEVQFYRARTSDNFTKYERKDMLHIPFDKRHLIATERFSIPGLPCLYLGSTSFCCWMEIGNPADHQFNVSYVHVKEDNKILSLTMNSDNFEAILDMECTDIVNNGLRI